MTSIARKFGLFRNSPNTTLFPVGATIFQEGDRGDSMIRIGGQRAGYWVALPVSPSMN